MLHVSAKCKKVGMITNIKHVKTKNSRKLIKHVDYQLNYDIHESVF